MLIVHLYTTEGHPDGEIFVVLNSQPSFCWCISDPAVFQWLQMPGLHTGPPGPVRRRGQRTAGNLP
ncbi:hypothetical protein DPMN_011153 [Dreissena polymorpha]|uniref:Uncharacterized protein n=1 Tax=Dreissena polymorpha TaxID=45954 RepID=A0A9D4N008_DREPO|nr:hypothetical protein DPMN_011153 [Dreissena polymorpha]